MKKSWKFPSMAGKFFIPALALFSLTQCSEDEDITPNKPEAEIHAKATGVDPVMSLTVDGLHTEFVSVLDCKTCKFVVPADASVVDGKKLGIKPGEAICLDAAVKYGNLEFVNLIGEEKRPIIIAYSMAGVPDEVESTEE